jgi:diaminopimelate epimerase
MPLDDPVFVAIGRAIRHHPTFAPAGTNVDVIQVLDGQRLRMRTYERGVEDETLACGSGAVASACVALAEGLVSTPVTVITRSGRALNVACDWNAMERQARNVTLTGAARVIVDGVIGPEALR